MSLNETKGGSMLEVKQHVKQMIKQGDETCSEMFIKTCKREK
jgi:hypothetical protein